MCVCVCVCTSDDVYGFYSQGEGGEVRVVPSRERVLLQRTGLEGEKNSDMVKALVRANPSYASSAISSLLGGSKDDSCKL